MSSWFSYLWSSPEVRSTATRIAEKILEQKEGQPSVQVQVQQQPTIIYEFSWSTVLERIQRWFYLHPYAFYYIVAGCTGSLVVMYILQAVLTSVLPILLLCAAIKFVTQHCVNLSTSEWLSITSVACLIRLLFIYTYCCVSVSMIALLAYNLKPEIKQSWLNRVQSILDYFAPKQSKPTDSQVHPSSDVRFSKTQETKSQ